MLVAATVPRSPSHEMLRATSTGETSGGGNGVEFAKFEKFGQVGAVVLESARLEG